MFEDSFLTITIASGVAAFIAAYYSLYVSQKPKVYAGSAKLRTFLSSNVKTLRDKFYPNPLLFEGRLQTIFGIRWRTTHPSKLPYEREILELSDGGEVALDYWKGDQPKSERPFLVLFLPGLTSSSQTSYVRTLVCALEKAGASILVFNNRGNAGVPFKTSKTYSASYIGDLEEVLVHIKTKFPAHRIIGLGTSLGGMILSKYARTKPEEARKSFECVILVSIAWDWVRGCDNFEKPFVNKYLINKALTLGLIKLVKKLVNNFENVPLKFKPEEAIKAKTVREFDAAVTAPQFDFPNVLEYYKSASSTGQVYLYSIPVFALSAEDDPLQPGNLLPKDEAVAPGSKLALITTSRGGHLGWVEGITRHSEHYMERLLSELVQAIRIYGSEELVDI